LNFYNDYIFLAAYLLLSILVLSINCKGRRQPLIFNVIPILLICALNFIYGWALPTLYKIYKEKIDGFASLYLLFYGYPIIDLALYSLTLILGSFVDRWIKSFFTQIHFYILGYGVGMILLVGYTEV